LASGRSWIVPLAVQPMPAHWDQKLIRLAVPDAVGTKGLAAMNVVVPPTPTGTVLAPVAVIGPVMLLKRSTVAADAVCIPTATGTTI
jgi:hypothetical protein